MNVRRGSVLLRAVVVVGIVLAVVAAGLVGFATRRDGAASAAPAAPVVPGGPVGSRGAAVDAGTAAGRASGGAGVTSSGNSAVNSAVVASSAVVPSAAIGLFTGAVYGRGARSVPSTGGVRLSTPYRGPLSGTTIVVDPGHQGVWSRIIGRQVPDGTGGTKNCQTMGTATRGGYSEHAHNWAVATRLAGLLRSRGARVVLTRPSDAGFGPCVNERAAIGNRAKANLVISIHADGSAAGNYGFHVIRSTRMAGGPRTTAASARLAVVVRDTFHQVTGRPRSTYLGGGTGITPRTDIAGTNLSTVPAVMVETGNMGNATEARLLRSPAFQDKEAAALALAAQRYLRR